MDKCRPSRKQLYLLLLANCRFGCSVGATWSLGLPLPVPRERGRVRIGLGNRHQRILNPSPSSSPLTQGERRHRLAGLLVIMIFTMALCQYASGAIAFSHGDIMRIGKRVWRNECNGTVSGLTAWNEGEDFASLGIGHFIWYPKGRRGPFEESFPKLIAFISTRGAKLPTFLLGADAGNACPWNSRAEFGRAQNSVEMNQLRRFLADTIDLQAEFLVARLDAALPKMLAEAAPADRPNVQQQFERLKKTPQGCYALVDYVNFKGEGVMPTERYHGQGWGLLQVL